MVSSCGAEWSKTLVQIQVAISPFFKDARASVNSTIKFFLNQIKQIQVQSPLVAIIYVGEDMDFDFKDFLFVH